MKVIIINYHPQDVIGGSEIQCDLIARHLTRLGHDVVYLAVNGKQPHYQTEYLVEPGQLTWKDLRRIVLKHSPDIVLWRFSKRKFLLSALVLKLMKVKLVFSVCNMFDVTPWAHKIRLNAPGVFHKLKLLRALLLQLMSSRVNHFGYRFVSGIIAQSEQQTHKVPVQKEVVIYNSADDTAVPFSWDKPFIIWVANLKPRKNPETYIELAKHFQHTGIDFLMVGKMTSSKYRYLLNKTHIPPNVHYLGAKTYTEVNGIIQQALFLVHTTYGPEGFPNVFIQAWLQGKPIISFCIDPDHFIQENKLGYLSGSFEQLLKDTQEFIQNKAEREQMGQHAKIFAEQHFNSKRNVRNIEAFLQEICEM